MTRNESIFLDACVKSIIATVTVPIHIYIIDNASNKNDHFQIMDALASRYPDLISCIYNKKNLWILGLNKILNIIKDKHNTKYFLLTDGDIDFSKCEAKPCWLSYLLNQMDKNISIGKIGLSLSWDILKKEKKLENILSQEKSLYNQNRKINDLYVSGVDTTACIYRWDWSIEKKPNFYPDHMRYLRPELYSCRTNRNITVVHLGWITYLNPKANIKEINEKILCFTLVGGDVKNEILAKASPPYKFFYVLFAKIIKKFWYIRRYYFLFKYILTKGIRSFDGQA